MAEDEIDWAIDDVITEREIAIAQVVEITVILDELIKQKTDE